MTVESGSGKTYAERLRTNISYNQRLQRNVLEIVLEKTDSDAEVEIDQNCITRIMRSLGMDLESQVEGCQVQFNGRSHVVSIWAAKGINLEKYCKIEGINVCKGVRTGSIRPAGRKDVTVTVTGLNWQTPDSLLFEYIRKFGGEIISSNVIYGKFTDGPLKGKYNGDRKYQVDFSNCIKPMGTYHFLDGTKVRISYRGNARTCGRCHGDTNNCKGKGIARDCESAGGERVSLHDHMRSLWSEIKFTPGTFELPKDISEGDLEADIEISSNQIFPRNSMKPQENEADSERYVGISIANINKDIEDKEICDFVRRFVSKNINDEEINIIRDKRKAVVTVSQNLSSETVKIAMKRLNFSDCKQTYFEKSLYCTPLRNITPEKPKDPKLSAVPDLPNSTKEKTAQRKSKESETPKSAFSILMEKAKNKSSKINEENTNSASPILRTDKTKTKRDSNQLSSPSSPQETNEPKKNKWAPKVVG